MHKHTQTCTYMLTHTCSHAHPNLTRTHKQMCHKNDSHMDLTIYSAFGLIGSGLDVLCTRDAHYVFSPKLFRTRIILLNESINYIDRE